jgi:predicted transcriptional regulator
MKRLPKAVELQRLEAYTKTADDDSAAQMLGLRKVTFVAWRNREHLPCKRLPGQRKHVTFQQERLLEYLAANPWSKLYATSKAIGVHSWITMDRLHRLEDKGLLKICVLGRVRRYALKDAEPLKGGMALSTGAPGFYHTNIRGRIEDLLQKEPWLPMCLIEKRLHLYGTPKSIESALLSMVTSGRVQRRVVETPKRRMYLYATPGRRLSKLGERKTWKEVASTTAFWKTNDKILKALRLRPWQTAKELAKAEGIDTSYVYNALNALVRRDLVRRLRVKLVQIGRARPADYVYGLSKQKDPKRLLIMQETDVHLAALQKSADILRGLGYQVDLEVHPPEMQKVPPMVHVDDVEISCDVAQFQEAAAK